MEPIFTIENLSEHEKEWFIEQNLNWELSLKNALKFLDHDALVKWLTHKIENCKECLHNAYRELEYKQSSLNGLSLTLFVNLYGFIPITPAEYCLSYKWLSIYEIELTNILSSKDNNPTGFESYVISKDSIRKAKIISVLHDLIDGKKGKWVALVIRCSIDNGLITRPKHIDLITEFGNVIKESNYKKYLSTTTTPKEKVISDINIIERHLSQSLE